MSTRVRLSACLAALSWHTASAAAPDCVPDGRVDVAAIDRQVVLIGEVHGTAEIPRFTLGFVCSLLGAGRSVVLAIEHAGEQQEGLNRYLRSAVAAADRQALLQGINWKIYGDGRGSVAMFELVDGIRRLRQQGQRVGVITLDRIENIDVPLTDDERVPVAAAENAALNRLGNQEMGNSVLYAALLDKRYTVVVLAGYSHTSTVLSVDPSPWFGTYQPMGRVIEQQMPTFTIGLRPTAACTRRWVAMAARSIRSERAISSSPTRRSTRRSRSERSPLRRTLAT